MSKRLFTSESVTEGHPDKVCDQVSDAILDAILTQDKTARVAVETCVKSNIMYIMGEVTTTAKVDYEQVARDTILGIGYDRDELGFNGNTCKINVHIVKQSPDISMGVSDSLEHRTSGDKYDVIGAGDQGMMFGFACDETEELMPLPISLAHKLVLKLTEIRKSGKVDYLRPDGKAQVTAEYEGNTPVRIDAIVVSAQHEPDVDMDKLKSDILEYVIKDVIPSNLMDNQTKIYINPTGRFVVGGPLGDSGLTGRKIIVDTYGGYCTHGGGCFSGKDPTKVDRAAAYMARYACKNVVAAGLARKCQIDLAYAIGVAKPVAIYVNTYGTGIVSDAEIASLVFSTFDFRPKAIIDTLHLAAPIYKQVASYGHFGRNIVPWEKLDKVAELKDGVKKFQ